MPQDNLPKSGFDLAGIGKIAEAIPDEVYTRTTESLVKSFESLVAPIVETSAGLGRYIRQKFDNMVDVEKALAIYGLEQAIAKANLEARNGYKPTQLPRYSKSFVRAIEEISRETNPQLHQWWVNLIASELVEGKCHPHLIEILPHLSSEEAKILSILRELNNVGENGGGYLLCYMDTFKHWVLGADDKNLKLWSVSCVLLVQLGLADILSINGNDNTTILYRTTWGTQLLRAVAD